jgi:DNA-binding Lrp family transcriptional regulator
MSGKQNKRKPLDGRIAVEAILSRLQGVRQTAGGWMAQCPSHEDSQRSLSIALGEDGRVLLHCFAGCAVKAVMQALGMKMRDLFGEPTGGGRYISPENPATVQPPPLSDGLSLAQYAEAKRLPVEFLESLGLSEICYLSKPSVRIPYLAPDGSEIAVRFRLALTGDDRFRWKSGTKQQPYGLQRLAEARSKGFVVLNEGESDTQTLWLHGIPALGLPGAASWQEEWARHLDDIDIIYLIVEPDQGGEAVLKWLATSCIRARAYLLSLGEYKDPSALYLADPENFAQHFQRFLQAAIPWTEHAQLITKKQNQEAWEQCQSLAQQPRILDVFARDLARRGVAGESRVGKLIYLALTSRFLERPVPIAVKGPSSGGKSYLIASTLSFFPPSAYYALTAMSERSLAYSQEPLKHRFLVIYEVAGMQGDIAGYLMRSLLSEGCVRYETVEKTSQGLRPRLIQREGPTGLLITTTAVHLHPENETRMISVTVNDTPEQTRAVLRALAKTEHDSLDLTEWLSLQEWLEGAEHRVIIPFAEVLAEIVPAAAVRLRRDFGAILNLISAHAILHQAIRARDAGDRIVATTDDYVAVRELVADLVAEGVEATVSEIVRETVEAVGGCLKEEGDSITIAALARRLKLDKSAMWRRVKSAIALGYLKNEETRKGRPARLALGDPLPDEVEVLPAPEKIEGCRVADGFEGMFHPPSLVVPVMLRMAWPSSQVDEFASSQKSRPAFVNAGDGLDTASVPEVGQDADNREREPLALTATAPSPIRELPCNACGSTRFWRSIYGAVSCGTCHPPGSQMLIAEWLDSSAPGTSPKDAAP